MLIWNAPGYLASEPVDNPRPTAGTYAERLKRFLDDLDISSVHLVGHSLGTLIAASFARRFPDRVEGLVLASAAQGYGVLEDEEMPAKVQARIDDLDRLGPKAFAASRAANLVYDPDENAHLVACVESGMAQINPSGYAQAVRLLASGDLAGDLRAVSIQPRFIIGTEDRVTPIAQTRAAAAAWEDAHDSRPPVCEIAGAGHAVYMQKPQEFCSALVRFLQVKNDPLSGSASTPRGGMRCPLT